ncbi:hypothetical protein [Pseudonocardia sp. DLS-67]
MDPVTLVVTAVALGASAGLTDTATTAVKDAYAGLKGLLGRRSIDVSGVERRPGSTARQTALHEDLAGAAEPVDDELLAAARAMTDAVATHDTAAAQAIGVDLRDVQSAFIKRSSRLARSPRPAPAYASVELPRDLRRRLVEAGELTGDELPAEIDEHDREMLAKAREAHTAETPRPVAELLSDVRRRNVVLLGDPGAGKSSLLRYVALSLAAETQDDEVRATLSGSLRALDRVSTAGGRASSPTGPP